MVLHLRRLHTQALPRTVAFRPHMIFLRCWQRKSSHRLCRGVRMSQSLGIVDGEAVFCKRFRAQGHACGWFVEFGGGRGGVEEGFVVEVVEVAGGEHRSLGQAREG